MDVEYSKSSACEVLVRQRGTNLIPVWFGPSPVLSTHFILARTVHVIHVNHSSIKNLMVTES